MKTQHILSTILLSFTLSLGTNAATSSNPATAPTVGSLPGNSNARLSVAAGDSIIFNMIQPIDTDTNGNAQTINLAVASTSVTVTITNQIAYIKGVPKIVTSTNYTTNVISADFAGQYDISGGNGPAGINSQVLSVNGPATLFFTNVACQYKYLSKSQPYQTFIIPAGSTNNFTITIPANQKMININYMDYDNDQNMNSMYVCQVNGINLFNPTGGITGNGDNFFPQFIYGPATLTFSPFDPTQPSQSLLYLSYQLVALNATNYPCVAP